MIIPFSAALQLARLPVRIPALAHADQILRTKGLE
ncbi:hypothetical protein SAMN06298226_1974 [Nitrosovibrio sp. Nv4]|nr:hypothetical protein SAMN06298226_1974 [Nitrosovibrio sp. Nv4]